MELKEAKGKFIQVWGTLGSQWGINRTMAQIHALLLVAPEALSADQIMEELNISRGNANMNLRALMDWGLVFKELRPGERREFFYAEKDIWVMSRRILEQRKKRELEPAIKVLDQVSKVDGPPKDPEVVAFEETVHNLRKFVGQIDSLGDKMIRAEQSWFFGSLIKLLK